MTIEQDLTVRVMTRDDLDLAIEKAFRNGIG